MRQTSLAKWLKLIFVGIGLCCLVVCAFVIPMLGKELAESYNGEFAYCYWPWLIFIWASNIPCFLTLAFAWRIASNIGANKSFSIGNANLLKWISVMAAGDSVFFFLGNIVFLLLDMSHPSIVLLGIVIVFIGIAIAVFAAALSHLVMKAAVLQDESDLTI